MVRIPKAFPMAFPFRLFHKIHFPILSYGRIRLRLMKEKNKFFKDEPTSHFISAKSSNFQKSQVIYSFLHTRSQHKNIQNSSISCPLYAGKIVLLVNQIDDKHAISCNIAITAKLVTLRINND